MTDLHNRFWLKVSKTKSCWLWQAGKHVFGYGQISYKRRPYGAHRISWMLTNGTIPEGLCVLHHCDVPACVNPSHLYLGSPKDNSRDRDIRNRHGKGYGFKKTYPKKLTGKEVAVIRKLPDCGTTHKDIAKIFNVSRSAISEIARHEIWRYGG